MDHCHCLTMVKKRQHCWSQSCYNGHPYCAKNEHDDPYQNKPALQSFPFPLTRRKWEPRGSRANAWGTSKKRNNFLLSLSCALRRLLLAWKKTEKTAMQAIPQFFYCIFQIYITTGWSLRNFLILFFKWNHLK